MTSRSTKIALKHDQRIWAFRLEIDRNEEEDGLREALDQSMIYILHGGCIDWSDCRFRDEENVMEEWCKRNGIDEINRRDLDVSEPFRFRSEIQTGHYVIVTSDVRQFRAFGEVVGKYEFYPAADVPHHRRKVKWIWHCSVAKDSTTFYRPKFGRQRSIKELKEKISWHKLETLLADCTKYKSGMVMA